MRFTKQGNSLCIQHQTEQIRIEPWGKNALRVRATKSMALTGNNWALTESLSPADQTSEHSWH